MSTNERKRRQRPQGQQSGTQVVYTQPKVFNRRRFFIRLVTVFAVVLALVFGLSIFFKVDEMKVANKGQQSQQQSQEQQSVEGVNVSGNTLYSANQIMEASGIQKGDYLLSLSKAKISSRIMQKLPFIKSVRIEFTLPGTVSIEVEELAVTYAIEATDETWWLVDCNGKVIEKINAGDASTHTKILGIKLNNPKVANKAVAQEPTPQTDDQGQVIPVTVKGSERLAMALRILQELEKNNILGEAASVDVTNMGSLEIWYAKQYQIKLGNSDDLEKKVQMIKGAIDQMGDYRSGVLDVTFEIRPGEVVYTPFE